MGCPGPFKQSVCQKDRGKGIASKCKVVKKGKKAGKIAWKKVKTVKKPKTTKCTVKISAKQRKVLKKKGKIYYSVRAYKKVTVNGKKKTIYSVYSQKKLK